MDIFDAILIIRTEAALKSFSSHKATLGTDIGYGFGVCTTLFIILYFYYSVAAGPFGAGAAIEAGKERAPVLSYVKSRGFYAGVQLVGQVFIDRFGAFHCLCHPSATITFNILSQMRMSGSITGLVSKLAIS